MNVEYVTYKPDDFAMPKLKRSEVFAWIPVTISHIYTDAHGIQWLKRTNNHAWLRKVVKCEGVFETWYELPKEENK